MDRVRFHICLIRLPANYANLVLLRKRAIALWSFCHIYLLKGRWIMLCRYIVLMLLPHVIETTCRIFVGDAFQSSRQFMW